MRTRPSSSLPARTLPAILLLSVPAWSQTTSRVSLGPGGAEGNERSFYSVGSPDGRWVVFDSLATNLVPGDTNGKMDVFVRDRQTGTTELVSVASAGAQGDGPSDTCCISADGRYVAFSSAATNLVAGDTNGKYDVFVRDRVGGTTERVSVDSLEAQGDSESGYFNGQLSISADGRYVAFNSYATNLVPGDTNGPFPQGLDVFVRDRLSGTTERVSVDSSGAQGNGSCGGPALSPDGRYVFFGGFASNLVPGDTNASADVFVRDRLLGTTERVSLDSSGGQGNGSSADASISPDCRYVAFQSSASNLVPGDTNAAPDIFVRDRQLGTTERVSISSLGVQAGDNCYLPSISADGRFVAFSSGAPNLVPGDTNIALDVFVRDRQLQTTERISVSPSGVQGDDWSGAYNITVSSDGALVFFDSWASNLVPGDTNDYYDVFVHDRNGTGFSVLCEPGAGGVIACPCQNPPSGPGRGCDNSSATGGATIAAAGAAALSADGLGFTTGGQKPTAACMLVQGTLLLPAGVAYGQGVRCVGGLPARLYTHGAIGGSATFPDLGAGDPPVSVRSAAIGDAIGAGQTRWYFVYYRDATVLGGCPLASTFNVTPTVQVPWGP